ALTILRVVRGWTQDDLAKASGTPNSSISDYERGKKVPSLKTLERLTAAMGFSIQSLQRARRFIEAVRSESLLTDLAMEWPEESVGFEAAAEPAAFGSASPAALQWEVDQLSAEAGRVVSRLTRTMLVLMSRSNRPFQKETGSGNGE
ncbi:MAG TPA: helix-turn-helix transcriptional regulator, partial [Thermoanaerobaculia bacterium]|nr:helix-turn-helix transcriptional regulator [Thermoanaerobaculia bacterium]